MILAEDFMKHLAPLHWPKGKRHGYCWLPPGSGAQCRMNVRIHQGIIPCVFEEWSIVLLSFYIEGHQGFAAVHLIIIFSCDEINYIENSKMLHALQLLYTKTKRNKYAVNSISLSYRPCTSVWASGKARIWTWNWNKNNNG